MDSRWGLRKRLPCAVAAVAMCIAAACGSTVPTERRALAARGELGSSGASAASDAAAAGDTSANSSGDVAGSGRSATVGGSSTRSTTAGGTAGAKVGSVALPAKAAPISVGVLTLKRTDAVPALSSFHDVPLVYPKDDYAAVISWINAHGGFGGHQVNPVFFETDVVDTNGAATEQAECATFAQDNHVSFVISDRSASSGVLLECLAKQHIPLLFDFPGYNVRAQFTDKPGFLYAPSAPDAETVLWNWVRGMGKNYFGANAKVGILMPDQPKYSAAVDKSLKPALASLHLTLADAAKYNSADTSALPGQISGAVLKFKAEGITHVLAMDTSGWGVTLLFMNDAQSQGYFPRYGLNSANSPDFLRQNVPPQQLHGAMGISWIPIIDVGTEAVPPDNAAGQQCMKIYDAAGLGSSDQTTKGVLQWFCSLPMFLKAALDKSTSASTFQGAVAALGTSWESPRAGITQFTPGRYTGDQSFRVIGFDDTRGYFTFLGGAVPLEASPG